MWHVWLFDWCLWWRVRFGLVFVEVCVTVCLVCVKTCEFWLGICWVLFRASFLKFWQSSASVALPGPGNSVDTQTRQVELLNSTTWITTLDSILISFLSAIAHCINQWNPILCKTLFLCTIEQVPQTKHKSSKIFVIWVQLYSSGLCLEEFFVIVA